MDTTSSPERIHEAWRTFASSIGGLEAPRVYIAGPPDSGKTTLARYLLDLEFGKQCAYLDCDPGQSTVGPPTTIGLRTQERDEILRFAGSTSPRSYLLENVVAISHLARRADPERPLLVDSSGYVEGGGGQAFQHAVIELLRPDAVAVVGEGQAFEHIEKACRGRSVPRFARLPSPRGIVARSSAARREYRDRRFQDYFSRATAARLSPRDCALLGRLPVGHDPGPAVLDPEYLQDRIVALLDADQLLVALTIASGVVHGDTLELLTPLAADTLEGPNPCVTSLFFSDLRLDRSGWQGPGP